MSDRIEPPRPFANVRAEEAVIGKIIGSAESYWAVADHLSAEHFTRPHHRDIFAAVARCCQEGPGPSLSLLEARLPQRWDGMEGDAAAWLVILQEKALDVSSAQDFVDDILIAWRERERVAIAKIAADPSKTFDEQKAAVEARFRAIEDIDNRRQAVTLGQAAFGALRRSAEAFQNKGKKVVGLYTGISEIDAVVGPLIGGTVVTIAAESGHGKSALLSQILRNNGMPSLDMSRVNSSMFVSMEMSELQNGYRNLASLTGISISKQIRGDFTEKEFDDLNRARSLLEQMPIHILDRGRLSIQEVARELRAAKRRFGIKAAGIDHVKLFDASAYRGNIVQTIEQASGEAKALAKELDIVIFLLAQITKEGQKLGNWRFKRSDIYGGGLLVENSDVIIGAAVPIEWLRQNKPEPPSEAKPQNRIAFDQWLKDLDTWNGRAEFAALKMRDGPGSEWKQIDFHGSRMLFGNIDREPVPF